MRTRLWMLAAAVLVLGCADRRAPTMPPSYVIQDAVHGSGVQGFYWLPPMVSQPTFSGQFNAGLSPIVEISTITSGCVFPVIQFTMTSGPGSETVRVNPTDEYYIVNWHAADFGLDPACTYRIRALLEVGGQRFELGIADVDVVSNGAGLKSVQTGEFIGLVDNRTLPIKFRPEQVMSAPGGQGCTAGRDCVVAVVGAQGGTVTTPQLRAGLQIPDAATDIARIILIEERAERPCFPPSAMALRQFNECYLIQSFPDVPFGDGDPRTLADNYTAGLCVELPPGMTIEQARRLQVFRFDAEAQVLQALQNVPAPFLPCNEQVPSAGTIGLWRFLRDHVAALLLPRRLYAAVAMVDFGVGGSGTETSLFTWSLPSQMTANSPQNQSATSGAPVATPPSVIVKDFGGNPVEGVTVTFSAATGNGTINGASLPVIVVTGSAGIASLGSWTLPSTAGTFTLTASAPGVGGSPVTFTATAVLSTIFLATFAADVLDAQPGPPEIGTWTVIGQSAGTIRVRSAVGNLTNKPVELNQVAGLTGGVDLIGTVAGTPPSSGTWVARWRSLASSSDVFFGPVVLRDGSGLIIASLEYRPGGLLSYNTTSGSTPQSIGVSWTQNVAQLFEITVNLGNKTTNLAVNGTPLTGFQGVPFFQSSAANLARLGFELGGTSAQTLAWDDLRISGVLIANVNLSGTTLTIGGPAVSYTATVVNGTDATLSTVVVQGWIDQGAASRAAGGLQVVCGAGIGNLPPGTCNVGFTLLASNATAGTGTLVPGSATARFELKQDGTVLDTFTLPVTLVSP